MAVRKLPQHVDTGTVTVVFTIAVAIGALTRLTGFSPLAAVVVGASTASMCWWAVRSEP